MQWQTRKSAMCLAMHCDVCIVRLAMHCDLTEDNLLSRLSLCLTTLHLLDIGSEIMLSHIKLIVCLNREALMFAFDIVIMFSQYCSEYKMSLLQRLLLFILSSSWLCACISNIIQQIQILIKHIDICEYICIFISTCICIA